MVLYVPYDSRARRTDWAITSFMLDRDKGWYLRIFKKCIYSFAGTGREGSGTLEKFVHIGRLRDSRYWHLGIWRYHNSER
jgi:hypothetical protein